MMIKKILVVGGTGMLGFPVARQLQQDGYEVDILTRNPQRAAEKSGNQFKYIKGNVENTPALYEIFKEYQGVHINLNSTTKKELWDLEVAGCKNIALAAAGSGIKKITLISGSGTRGENASIWIVRAKLECEQYIKETGIAYTIFNCTHFMESIDLYIRNGKAMVIGNQPHKIHWLAAGDYAKMVSKSYEVRESDFHNYTVVGPEPFSMKEAFTKYVEKLNPDIKVEYVSPGMLKIIALITFNAKLKYVVDLMRYFEKIPERYDPKELPEILGPATTTLDSWLDQRKRIV